MGALAVCIPGLIDPEILKSIACNEGFSLAAEISCWRGVISTDCADTIEHVQGVLLGTSRVVIKEIKSQTEDLDSKQIIHEKRDFNMQSHIISIPHDIFIQ